jgi:hypothetical protein
LPVVPAPRHERSVQGTEPQPSKVDEGRIE